MTPATTPEQRTPSSPHRWPPTQILLLLLALLACTPLPSATKAPHAGGPAHSHPLRDVSTFLPHCAHLASALSPADHARLRGKVQHILHSRKRQTELNEFIYQQQHPSDDPKMRHAYKTTRAVPELQADLAAVLSNHTQLMSELDVLLSRLKGSGHLPANATLDYVAQCTSTSLDPGLFPYRPQVSFLLQYFRRPHVVERYVARLQAVATVLSIPCELVVNVDSKDDAGLWALLSNVTSSSRPSAAGNHTGGHFSLFSSAGAAVGYGETVGAGFDVVPVLSANVHEARAYNRAAGVARGQVLVFLQDDDLPPRDPVWVHHLLRLLDKYPHVGAVGMQSYRYCVHGFPNQYQGDFFFWDQDLGLKMHWAGVVDFAPLALKKSTYEEVGGLDEGMSDVGQCGIFGDWELTTRLWVAGWQVMYMAVEGRESDGKSGGTHAPETGERCWGRQGACARHTYFQRYDPLIPLICERVRELNVQGLQQLQLTSEKPKAGAQPRPCPFGEGKCSANAAANAVVAEVGTTEGNGATAGVPVVSVSALVTSSVSSH